MSCQRNTTLLKNISTACVTCPWYNTRSSWRVSRCICRLDGSDGCNSVVLGGSQHKILGRALLIQLSFGNWAAPKRSHLGPSGINPKPRRKIVLQSPSREAQKNRTIVGKGSKSSHNRLFFRLFDLSSTIFRLVFRPRGLEAPELFFRLFWISFPKGRNDSSKGAPSSQA